MSEKSLVVINAAHQLMAEQKSILDEKFGKDGWARLDVPEDGWNAETQKQKLAEVENSTLVFASPLPLMLRDAARRPEGETLVFHNDNRVAKEVGPPNARKVVHVVAETGWQLL